MMRILIILLLFVSEVRGQIIINASAPYRSKFLLDQYGGAAAAYSLRRLNGSYTGAAIRVRRDSTGQAEQDIGFTNDGWLDTTALKNFVRNNSGYITIWYDQSGNTRNASQSTQANQPRIMLNGVIDRDGVLPSLFFDGSNYRLTTSSDIVYTTNDQFISTVSSTTNTITSASSANCLISGGINGNSSTPAFYVFFGSATGALTNERLSWITLSTKVYGYGQTTSNISGINHHIFQWYSTTSEIRQNGVSQSLSTSSNGGFSQNNNSRLPRCFRGIGFDAPTGGSFFNGKIQEIIIWGSNLNSSKTSIEANINLYYGIY